MILRNAPAPVDVVNDFLDAVETGDMERASECLSSDSFSYVGPIDRFERAEDLIEDLSRLGTILKCIERRRVFVDGDEVCVIVTYVTTVDDIANTRAAHWVRVENGRIVSIEGFLDTRNFARMFEPQP